MNYDFICSNVWFNVIPKLNFSAGICLLYSALEMGVGDQVGGGGHAGRVGDEGDGEGGGAQPEDIDVGEGDEVAEK